MLIDPSLTKPPNLILLLIFFSLNSLTEINVAIALLSEGLIVTHEIQKIVTKTTPKINNVNLFLLFI